MSHDLNRPILIVVTETRWDAMSLNSILSSRDLMLFQVFQEMGGVKEGTAPGQYSFNVEFLDDEHFAASLEPVED